MLLLQILLPIKDEKGDPFPEHYFTDLREELAIKFGGITIYSRSQAKGLWKESGSSLVTDEMIINEIMMQEVDLPYWQAQKLRLQELLRQDEILMRYHEVTTI